MSEDAINSNETPHWFVFGGKGATAARLKRLRDNVPRWRDFTTRKAVLAETYQLGFPEKQVVNAAFYLRRPLLVTGPPGSGKSSLAYAIAADLKLGEVLRWPINSRSTLSEGLYSYDALGRLRDIELEARDRRAPKQSRNISRYIRLNALGTALYKSDKPKVLLIDEIDKSDIDLPNDLLHVFEEGEFEIPELARIADEVASDIEVETAEPVPPGAPRKRVKIHRGVVRCTTFPFVLLTSNGERDLPPAFFRRCLRLELPRKTPPDRLRSIVKAHLGIEDSKLLEDLVAQFGKQQDARNLMANDQLLNAIFLITAGKIPEGTQRDELKTLLLRELNR
jgi:MoxR-like ATPase